MSIRVQYDLLVKYYKTYKYQGHAEEDCCIIHPELREIFEAKMNAELQKEDDKEHGGEKQIGYRRNKNNVKRWNPTNRRLKRI